jgi:hypothetical protein
MYIHVVDTLCCSWDEEDGCYFLFPCSLCSQRVVYNRVMDQFQAARHGDLQQLRDMLTVDNVNDVDDRDWTAIHCAAWYGHDDCVKCCIKMGANVNVRTNAGSTPLHLASDDFNVVRILLNAGARVDATDNYRRTPLYDAIRLKRVDVTRILIDRGAKVSNVKLDHWVPAIPDWVIAFIESRSNCRSAAIIMIGIHKYRRTILTGNNDVNVIRLISKHIWLTRMYGLK